MSRIHWKKLHYESTKREVQTGSLEELIVYYESLSPGRLRVRELWFAASLLFIMNQESESWSSLELLAVRPWFLFFSAVLHTTNLVPESWLLLRETIHQTWRQNRVLMSRLLIGRGFGMGAHDSNEWKKWCSKVSLSLFPSLHTHRHVHTGLRKSQ